MDINHLAPVIIPTLNRFTHFKRCLESLERCTWAEYTDVYVGLDFPPSDKYMEGQEKINEYLQEKENNNRFKHLFVRRRNHNCGAGKNLYLLLQEIIKEKYKSYIISEDDNEFAPNFLMFINKALDKYKDDPRIMRICGYTSPVFKDVTDKNMFCNIDSPAYGIANWLNDKHVPQINYKEIHQIFKSSFFKTMSLFFTYPALVYMAIHMVKSQSNYGDIRISMHNLTQGTFSICPSVSLVRNWGVDGSGLHSGKIMGIEKEVIQTDREFDLDDIEIQAPPKLKKKLLLRNMPKNKIKYIVYFIHKFLYTINYYFFYSPKQTK